MDISPHNDILGNSTDLEGALEKILFTPKPTLMKKQFCQRCDAVKRVPVGTTESPCECGATMK